MKGGSDMSADSLKSAIQAEYQETAPCTLDVSVKVPAQEVEKAFNDIVKEVAREVQIQGFRKGKVPTAIIKTRFAKNIVEDAAKQLQNAAIEKIQGERELVAVTALDDGKKMPEADKEYSFKLTIEVAPEIKLPDYKKLTVEVPKSEDAAKMLEERIANLKDIYADDVKVDTESVSGDMLKVSYETDFVPAEDASPSLKRMAKADEAWIWLHDPEYVPGANAALTGVKAGETKEFTAVFPADWRESGLAGKTVKYTVKVNEIQRKKPITDDAVLAEKLHMESFDKLKEEIAKSIDAKIKNDRKNAAREKVLDILMEKVGEIALPKSILEGETEREFSKIANQLVRSEADVEKFKAEKEKHLADAKKEAEKSLKRFFVVRKIADAEKLEVSKKEFDTQIKQMSSYFGYKEKDMLKAIRQNGAIGEIHADLLTGKVLDHIVATAEIKEV